MAFLRKKKVKFSVALVVEKLTDVPLLNAVIFAKVRLLECGSFVGTTLHRPVCSHQVDFMSPSVSRRFNSSAPSNIRMRSRTNSGQIYPNATAHRHSTTDIIDGSSIASSMNSLQEQQQHKQFSSSPASHRKFQQIERRHSLTERSPRELDDAPRKWDDFEEALKTQAENSQIDEASYQKILEQIEARNRKYKHLLEEDGIKNEFDELIQNRILASDQPEYFIDELGNLAHAEKNTQPFSFYCYIPYDSKYSGELEACRCKISLRKEDRAGRNPQKLGYVIINLSEFAGSGNTGIRKSFLLDGYFTSQRQDNSRVHIFIRMQHDSLDPLFKVPNSASLLFQQQNQNEIEDNNTNLLLQHDQLGQWLNPVDRRAPPPSPNEINNNNGVGGSFSGNVNNSTTNSGVINNNSSSSNPIPIIDSNNLLTATLPSTSASLTIQSTIGCPPPISLLATSLHLTSSSGCTKEHLQHYQHPKEERSSSLITNLSSNTSTIPSTSTTISSISSIFPTVPGGLGHNMSMRVQRTRRDPGDVIDEVLAENCATIFSSKHLNIVDDVNNNSCNINSNNVSSDDDDYKSS
uniref:C2 NT-type domain-containing protein n=1 Tax=Meloidogyne incognita TaxID=6306 RepID=A0A914KXU1_MELIC